MMAPFKNLSSHRRDWQILSTIWSQFCGDLQLFTDQQSCTAPDPDGFPRKVFLCPFSRHSRRPVELRHTIPKGPVTMKRTFGWTARKSFISLCLLLVASVWGGARWAAQRPEMISQTSQPDAATKARVNEMYGQLPLSFEANVGQTHPQIDFISRGNGYTLFLTPREAVLDLRAASASSATDTVLRMQFVDSENGPASGRAGRTT